MRKAEPDKCRDVLHKITSAVNCRPLNGFFLDLFILSPKPPKSAAFYPLSGPSKPLQQNPPECMNNLVDALLRLGFNQ